MYQSICMYMYIHICGMMTDAVLFSQCYQCEWNINRWWEWTEKRGWTKEQESSSIKSLLKLAPYWHFGIPWTDTVFYTVFYWSRFPNSHILTSSSANFRVQTRNGEDTTRFKAHLFLLLHFHLVELLLSGTKDIVSISKDGLRLLQ